MMGRCFICCNEQELITKDKAGNIVLNHAVDRTMPTVPVGTLVMKDHQGVNVLLCKDHRDSELINALR